ncbi:hypothetical protein Thimo_0528 [Thioflavicoccus mobilis 8321]|uniref:Uncharacterized protein n=1 Tax=Thioflavicoccus mobilis 8321 TaxID=765912 RepID=L0GVI3_9GAMM|nr:hypothetical protein [Thioflavicoccus mobilis]AGA89380.1 hypothetical protein Thimo_0528 [Thioflavicoccus mobilis 8321]
MIEAFREASDRLGLGLDLLEEGGRWRLLQGYLEGFCERLRRRAQSHRRRRELGR